MKRINLVVLMMILMGASQSWGGGEMIQKGSKVTLDFTLTVDGQIVDTSRGKRALQYIHGQEMLIPGLERALEGLKSGDEKKVSVSPEGGYGPVDPKAIVEVPKEGLVDEQDVSAGQFVSLKGKDGRAIKGVITQVKDTSIVIDFNHLLAGKILDFNINIVKVEGP